MFPFTGGKPSRPDRLLCLDIETVVDPTVLPRAWPTDRFPKPTCHKVVAIGYVQAKIECDRAGGRIRYAVETCRSGGERDWDEGRLLRGFWALFESHAFQVVTWNGRSFAMPVLLMRAMAHGIATPGWYARGHGRDSYGQRYGDWHVDLMDVLCGYGASARMGLDETCASLGLPGKPAASAGSVAGMVERGEIDRVRDDCESDALNTHLLFLRWCHASGKLTASEHDEAVGELAVYLAAERGTRPHLGAFLDAWTNHSRPTAMRVSPA